jgi:hypothetical protein
VRRAALGSPLRNGAVLCEPRLSMITHDFASRKLGRQNLLDIKLEALAIDRPAA